MKFEFGEKLTTAEININEEEQRLIEASVLRSVRHLEMKPDHLLGQGGCAKVYFPERGLPNTCYKVLRSKFYPVVKAFSKDGELEIPAVYKPYLKAVQREDLPWSLSVKEESRITNKVATLALQHDSEVAVPMTYEYFKLQGEIDHPGKCYVHDDVEVLLMDRINGTDLEQLMAAKQHLPPDFDADVFMNKLDDFVELMHKNGIYHRDIALRNIMMDKEGNPALIDFGRSTDTVWEDDPYKEQIHPDGRAAQLFLLNDDHSLRSIREALVDYEHFDAAR